MKQFQFFFYLLLLLLLSVAWTYYECYNTRQAQLVSYNSAMPCLALLALLYCLAVFSSSCLVHPVHPVHPVQSVSLWCPPVSLWFTVCIPLVPTLFIYGIQSVSPWCPVCIPLVCSLYASGVQDCLIPLSSCVAYRAWNTTDNTRHAYTPCVYSGGRCL